MAPATSVVPPHLRRFVVEQDGAAYNAIDQAVWRFVLLQMHARLVETAHPIYREGLAATGLSVDGIPSVAEMNDRMSRFGWGAVCVDGFIPPRAFQEFQACGILPIAAEIRTREHLVYTPAPDIIHEAAGHAPILPELAFSGYLRRIGQLGAQAFTVPEEDRVFQAIRALSEAKEIRPSRVPRWRVPRRSWARSRPSRWRARPRACPVSTGGPPSTGWWGVSTTTRSTGRGCYLPSARASRATLRACARYRSTSGVSMSLTTSRGHSRSCSSRRRSRPYMTSSIAWRGRSP